MDGGLFNQTPELNQDKYDIMKKILKKQNI
jgi:hypothetical protein